VVGVEVAGREVADAAGKCNSVMWRKDLH